MSETQRWLAIDRYTTTSEALGRLIWNGSL